MASEAAKVERPEVFGTEQALSERFAILSGRSCLHLVSAETAWSEYKGDKFSSFREESWCDKTERLGVGGRGGAG